MKNEFELRKEINDKRLKDLSFDVILHDWSLLEDGRLVGAAYADVRVETAHSGFSRGERVTTSPVQSIRNKIAVTRSGTRYLLA